MKKFFKIVKITCILFAPALIIANPVPYRSSNSDLTTTDLRLSAMGDIDIVIEGSSNEINFYDFGELGAGIFDDNGGKSSIFIPGIFGFDMTEEAYEKREYFGGNIMARVIKKVGASDFLGGIVNFSKHRWQYNNWFGIEKISDKNLYDTLIFAHGFKNIFFGFRSGFITENKRYSYELRDNTIFRDILYGEPSLVMHFKDNPWSAGFGYRYEKYKSGIREYDDRSIDRYNTLILPVIYNTQDFNLGFKFDYQMADAEEGARNGFLFKLKTMNKINLQNKFVNTGIIASYDTKKDYYSEFWIWDKKLNAGFGISYMNRLGIQYEHQIFYDEYNRTSHFNRISQGCEINIAENLFLRAGYTFGFTSPYRFYLPEKESIISSGIGFCSVNLRIKIDLFGRLNFIREDDWWWTEPNFGIAWIISL